MTNIYDPFDRPMTTFVPGPAVEMPHQPRLRTEVAPITTTGIVSSDAATRLATSVFVRRVSNGYSAELHFNNNNSGPFGNSDEERCFVFTSEVELMEFMSTWASGRKA